MQKERVVGKRRELGPERGIRKGLHDSREQIAYGAGPRYSPVAVMTKALSA